MFTTKASKFVVKISLLALHVLYLEHPTVLVIELITRNACL